jgi:hypothetical protein
MVAGFDPPGVGETAQPQSLGHSGSIKEVEEASTTAATPAAIAAEKAATLIVVIVIIVAALTAARHVLGCRSLTASGLIPGRIH